MRAKGVSSGTVLAIVATLLAVFAMPGVAAGRTGALDRSFGDNGKVVVRSDLGADVHVAEGPNGTILAATDRTVFRFLPDGSLDPGFGEGGKLTVVDPEGLPFSLHDLVVDPEGHIYLLGEVEIPSVEVPISYISSRHPPLAAVVRYTADGKLDSAFNDGKGFLVTELGQKSPYGTGVPYEKAMTTLTTGVVDHDGDLVAIGSVGEIFTGFRSELAMIPKIVARLTPTGQLDPAFGGGDGVVSETGLGALTDLVQYGDNGLLVAGGDLRRRGRFNSEAITLFGLNGEIDPSFGQMGTRGNLFVPPLADMAVSPFGGIVTLSGRGVLRLMPNGTLDRRFGTRGRVAVGLPGESVLNSVAIEPSGPIFLAGTQSIRKSAKETDSGSGYRSSFTVIGLGPHGGPDRHFGNHGWITTRFGKGSNAFGEEAFVDSDGRLVVGGQIARPDLSPPGGIALARYDLGR